MMVAQDSTTPAATVVTAHSHRRGSEGSEEGDGVDVDQLLEEMEGVVDTSVVLRYHATDLSVDELAKMAQGKEVLGAAGAGGSAEWDIGTWMEGFEGATIHAAVADVLRRSKPESTAGDGHGEYEWCRELAGKAEKDPGLIASMLGTALVEQVAAVLNKQLRALHEQVAATAAEQNDKFVQGSEAQFMFGKREDFDLGLNELIGFPNDEKVVAEMFREHCEYASANKTIVANNYGVTTTPLEEWKAAAGRWTTEHPRFEAVEGFKAPRETCSLRHLPPKHFRQIIPLETLLDPPTLDELREWTNPTAEEQRQWDSEETGPCDEPAARAAVLVRRGRRCVWRAGLTAAEVLALRMWSGPMFVEYNWVLRRRVRGAFTTTLHAVHSGIYKLSKVTPPSKVYRGVANRAITGKDLKAGSFVEMGAQSFTRDKNVALTYSRGKGDAASYLFEVQVVGDRVERGTVVLKMRINVNAKAGTIDEVVNRKHTWLKASAEMLLREAEAAPAVHRLEGKEKGASRIGDLQALARELQGEKEPGRFNDSECFMQKSQALTDTWKGVLRHAVLMEAVEELLGNGDAGLGPAIQEAEMRLLGLRARARLPKLQRRLLGMESCRKLGFVAMWQFVANLVLFVYVCGLLWIPWLVLWVLDMAFGLFAVSFFSGALADLQLHWINWVEGLFGGGFGGCLLPKGKSANDAFSKTPSLGSILLQLWGLETSTLRSAVGQLQQAAKGVVVDKRVLQDEIGHAEEAVQDLWARGGLRAKESNGGGVRSSVVEALAGLSTSSLAEEHRWRRFRDAVAHLVDCCGKLPMHDASTRVQLRSILEDAVGMVDGYTSQAEIKRLLEQKLPWMGADEGLKRRSVSRLLELFMAGTRQGEVVLSSSEAEDEWEAEHAGYFLCTCEYLDSFPLDQVCSGKLTTLEALALTRQQAAMLARFFVLHAPGRVELTVGHSRFPVLLGKGAASELFGLKKHVDEKEKCRLRNQLSTDVLWALVAAAKSSPTGDSSALSRTIRSLDLSFNNALGAKDGGEEAMDLLVHLAVIVFPELEQLECESCGLGDAGAAKLAEGVALLPQLQLVTMTGNRIGLRGKRQLRGAWSRGGKPANFNRDICGDGDHGLRLDLIDFCCWGIALSLCAQCFTCNYCCGRFPGERKSRRIADSSLPDSSSTMPRDVPAALRMEAAPSGEGRAGGTLSADVP
ncbi:hypothetical protein T484DRAFT_1987579 [Baffinella frigidus]|nr:hypothetical protein T484DRAFT_1987579 [Cryptophyta sp. CCMP2293]